MKFWIALIVFLIINFGALGIGTWLMDNGPQSEWYTSLNQAPWTPAGWVFGAAWTFIMICFSIYMAFLYVKNPSANMIALFILQFMLNVSWNYVFFNQHLIALGLAVIVGLTIVVALFLFLYQNKLKTKSLLILPYFLWLCIAVSLNAYILLNN